MTEPADLPKLWTHEPHDYLVFKPGDNVANIDTSATPGFKGNKNDARALQPERNERFAQLQEMLYANSRAADDTRSVLLVLQGMDTAGKGGIVKHVVGAANPQGLSTPASVCRPRKSASTTTCGASEGRCRRQGTSECSTVRTTRMC